MEEFASFDEISQVSQASSRVEITNLLTASFEFSKQKSGVPRLSLESKQEAPSELKENRPPKKAIKGTPRSRTKKQPSCSSRSFIPNSREEPASYTQAATNSVIRSLQSVLFYQYPQASGIFNKRDQKEIQLFFHSKTQEFENLIRKALKKEKLAPYQISRREKLKSKNKEKEAKREKIRLAREAEEIVRTKKANLLQQENQHKLLKKMLEKRKKEKQKEEIIEKRKKEKEQRILTLKEKEFIVDNIKNYFDDKIRELREKLQQSKFVKKIRKEEKIQVRSQSNKERREHIRMKVQKAKDTLGQQNEKFCVFIEKSSKKAFWKRKRSQ